MKNFLEQLRNQLKLFLLDKINWILPAAAFIMLFTNTAFKDHKIYSPLYFNRNIASLFVYLSIIYSGLCARFFLTEASDNHHVQWTRPYFRKDFVLVKFFSAYFGVSLFLSPVALILILRGLPFNDLSGLLQGFSLWLMQFIPTFLFVTAFSILIGLILRRTAPAMALSLAVILWLGIRTTSWSDLLNYTPHETYELIFGFGPALESLLVNRLFFTIVSIALLFFCLLLGYFRLPASKGKVRMGMIAPVSVIAVLSIISAALLGQHLHTLGKYITANPDIITLRKQQEFCDALRDYRLEIEIDRKGSITKALASVQLEQRLEPENYLLLIDSLKDQGVQIRETDVGEFQISYQGKFILPNYAYSSRLKEQGAALSGFLPGAFLDRAMMLMLAHGQWHPFSRCNLNALSLTVPRELEVNYHSAAYTSDAGDQKTYHWQSELPEVLFIAGGAYQESELNGQRALVQSHVGEKNLSEYRSSQERLLLFWDHIHEGAPISGRVLVLPLFLRSSFFDQSGNFFLRSVPVVYTLPFVSPDRQEIESNVDIVQAWWTQGRNDPTLEICFYQRFYCETPHPDLPDDKSVLPFLYYTSIKLASERKPEIVDAEEIISFYQRFIMDGSTLDLVPRIFSGENANELLVKTAKLDRCIGSSAYWKMLTEVRNASDGVWMTYEELSRAIEISTGYNLDKLEAQCPGN